MKRQPLFSRNFTLLILGQVSSLIGNYTLKFALSMYVLEQTGSASIFATLLAAAMLPTILLSPFGGILADRINRRNIMVALDTLSGISVLIAGAALSPGNDILVIGILLITLSVLAAFESPTVQACVPQMLSEENLLKGNSVVNQVQAIASLFTPFLGSLLYSSFGLLPVLWGTAVCFFLTAMLECLICLKHSKINTRLKLREIIREDFAVSFQFLCREQPYILKLLLLASTASLFVAGTVVIGFPYLVRTVLELSAEHYGAAESAMGTAAILGSLFVGLTAKKFRPCWLSTVFIGLGVCLVLAGIVFLLPLDSFEIFLVLLIAFCTSQFGCSLFSTYSISIIQGRTPEHLMGKVMSYVFTLSMCAQPLGQIAYGALFDWFSDHPCWVLLPSGVLLCLIGAMSVSFFAGMRSFLPFFRSKNSI